MLCPYKPSGMSKSEYARSINDMQVLECELGMKPGSLRKCEWKDLKVLYTTGKLYKGDMEILFNMKQTFNTSLYDCALNSECEIVHKSEIYSYRMQEQARLIRELF